MDPIQEAIKYIESREARDNFSYRKVAKIFGVDRTTLSRRHQGTQQPRGTEAAKHRRNLNPQQEDELISFVEGQTRDGVPPTRSILKKFASAVAQHEVSDSWVTQFQHRHPDELISK
jgi:transposase